MKKVSIRYYLTLIVKIIPFKRFFKKKKRRKPGIARIITFKFKVIDSEDLIFVKDSDITEPMYIGKEYSASKGILFKGVVTLTSFVKEVTEIRITVTKEKRINKTHVEYVKKRIKHDGWSIVTPK